MQGNGSRIAMLAAGIGIGLGVAAAIAMVGLLSNSLHLARSAAVDIPPTAHNSAWAMDSAFVVNMVPLISAMAIPAVLLVIVVMRISSSRRKSGTASQAGGMPDDDARIIQELHQGLERMDRRIESLETLIIEERSSNTERLRH